MYYELLQAQVAARGRCEADLAQRGGSRESRSGKRNGKWKERESGERDRRIERERERERLPRAVRETTTPGKRSVHSEEIGSFHPRAEASKTFVPAIVTHAIFPQPVLFNELELIYGEHPAERGIDGCCFLSLPRKIFQKFSYALFVLPSWTREKKFSFFAYVGRFVNIYFIRIT